MSAPLVSLVTVTRNRPELMERCVRSLAGTGYSPAEWIILDNSDEPQRAMLERALEALESNIELRLLTSSPTGFAALRQQACAAAKGERAAVAAIRAGHDAAALNPHTSPATPTYRIRAAGPALSVLR